MRTLRQFVNRLFSPLIRRQSEARLCAEIEEHIALATADHIRAGLSPAEARRQARLAFGAVEAIKETYRDRRGLPILETLAQDTRVTLRRLRKSPAFTAAVILTLALGIGATTSIFTLVDAVLLKSLAVANPAQLYRLGKEARCCFMGGYSQDKEFSLVSYQLYQYLRDHTQGFAELAAFAAYVPQFGVRRTGSAEPAQPFPGEYVSGNYFAMFGLRPRAGRLLTPADDSAAAPPVALMSYRLWQQKYGSDPAILGSVFTLNEKPFAIVGVTPPGFFGDTLRDTPPDFFLPLHAELLLDGDLNKYDQHWLELLGRIRPGVDPVAIEAQMRLELKQWLLSHWAEMSPNDRVRYPAQTLFLTPGGSGITAMRQEYEHWLQILMLVSAFALLIVCANVANLMLVRGLEGRRQISVSRALGAPAARIVRQALTESLMLALIGGAAGLAVAFASTRLILHFAFPPVPGMAAIPIQAAPSAPILWFAFGLSLLTGLAFGIAPAWISTRIDPIEALRGAARSTIRTASLYRKALVVFQASLALVLLSASGLLTAALRHLENQDFGFVQDRRLVAHIEPRQAAYAPAELAPLYRRLQDSLAPVPGISAVSLATYSPLSGGMWGYGVWIDGHPTPGPREDDLSVYDRVTAGYFTALGTPILRGRGITAQDTATSPHVAVISESFARKFFPHQDPIGKHFGRAGLSPRQYEIVGIVKSGPYTTFDLGQPPMALFFLPEAQHDFTPQGQEPDPGSHFLHDIIIVTTPGARLPFTQIRQAIAAVNPDLPVSVAPFKDQISIQFRQPRLIARLTSLFGLLALILASIGLYGVTAYNAGRRVSEIGVRIALGATRRQIAALILRGAFALTLAGLIIGIPLSIAAARFLGHQLYGLNPYDPAMTLLAVALLALSALAASLIPAWRATRIAPQDALRAE